MATELPMRTADSTRPAARADLRSLWYQFHQPPSWLRRLAACRVALYFLVGLVALDVLIYRHRALWNAYDPDDYRGRLEGCLRQPRDLVIVGGSPVSEGIDPTVLSGLVWHGTKLEQPFNLGLPGATTSEVWHAVEHGLPAPPRLLVYGITASDLNDSRFEPQGPGSLMDIADVVEWLRVRPDAAGWVVRHFIEERAHGLWQLFYYRNAIRLWAADQTARFWPDAFPKAVAEARGNLQISSDLCNVTGFAPRAKLQQSRLDRLKSNGQIGPRFHFLEDYRLGGHLQYLHKLLDWAAANGVSVVLVDMPVPADLDERMHAPAFATYRAALAEVARQRQVPLLHADRKTLDLDESDFADLIHLNKQGTARLSAWLRQALAALPK